MAFEITYEVSSSVASELSLPVPPFLRTNRRPPPLVPIVEKLYATKMQCLPTQKERKPGDAHVAPHGRIGARWLDKTLM